MKAKKISDPLIKQKTAPHCLCFRREPFLSFSAEFNLPFPKGILCGRAVFLLRYNRRPVLR